MSDKCPRGAGQIAKVIHAAWNEITKVWTLPVIHALGLSEPARFNKLKERIEGIVAERLKELAKRGLIEAHPEGRTMVYELTEQGRATLSRSLGYFERAFSDIFCSTATIPQKR